jgi:hypothetical protein
MKRRKHDTYTCIYRKTTLEAGKDYEMTCVPANLVKTHCISRDNCTNKLEQDVHGQQKRAHKVMIYLNK